jgi:electron transfer flavoprotein beta subunit
MYRLGALFNMPVVSNVVSFSMEQETVSAECEMAAGERQVIEMQLPCVIGAGKGLNVPNYPKLPDIIKANRKPVKTMAFADLNFEPSTSRIETIQLEPAVEKRTPKELTGTPGEVADQIIRILRAEANVIQ